MIGSKLLPILKSLDSTEFRRMRKIFQSPFFTTNERHLVLYDLLKKYHPIYDTPKLEKQKVFEKLYPGKPFNDGLLRVLIREFTQMVEEYLLISKLRKEDFHRKKLLSQIYKDHNIYDFFARETKSLLKELEKRPYRDWEYYKDTYDLNFDYFFHPLTQKLTLDDETLLSLMESLDKQFVLGKYRIGSEMKNRERTLSKQYEIHFLDSIKEVSSQIHEEDNSLLQLFSLLFEMYDSENKAPLFDQLKNLFSKSFQDIRQFDQSLFLTQLINYTIRQINVGKTEFYKEALDLYKIGLETELVLRDQKIDEAVFGNIVLLGCNASEFDWTENFIQAYKQYLKREVREDVVKLNKGLWYFYQGDFENAYDAFLNHAYSPGFQPKSRLNLIRSLLELFLKDESYYDLLIYQIEAFEKYLHRNTLISDSLREADLNSIAIMKRLASGIFNRKDKSKLKASLLNQIDQRKLIVVKRWLIGKIEAL